jgi:mRNA-degrading endonuclease RelE of RelBE toxin-antitoxin system
VGKGREGLSYFLKKRRMGYRIVFRLFSFLTDT